MNNRNTHALRGALVGITCAVGCASVALAGPAPKPPLVDSIDNPVPPVTVTKPGRASSRSSTWVPSGPNQGGIAAAPIVVLYNNGSADTGQPAACTPPGTSSVLPNLAPFCMNILGFNVAGNRTADDFILTKCGRVTRVRLFAYLTGAAAPTITAATVTLHSGQPWSNASNIVATSALIAEPPSFTDTYRMSSTVGCTRRLQTVVVDTSSWPLLPAGSYWISYVITGATFEPPVTVTGQQGSITGTRSQQVAAAGGIFGATSDPGGAGCVTVPPNIPPPSVALDFPFILEGSFGNQPCAGDRNDDCRIDVDDLVTVILTWGQPDASGTVDVDDLVTVILRWAQTDCLPPAPPVSTGACCTGTSCSVVTFAACAAGGGIYFGDGTNCSVTGGCLPPSNDECAGALTVGLGNTNLNTTLATNGGPAILAACAFQLSRDVWLALPTNNAQSYTVDTLLTPIGPGNVADTGLVIYRGDCTTLIDVNCNDDTGGGTLSTVSFVGDGTTHFIRVGSFVAAQTTTVAGGAIVVRIQ